MKKLKTKKVRQYFVGVIDAKRKVHLMKKTLSLSDALNEAHLWIRLGSPTVIDWKFKRVRA